MQMLQCNAFIFENEKQNGFDVTIARENYLAVSFHTVHLMNFRSI